MMHGSCRNLNPNTICMKNGTCKSHYPKSYSPKTYIGNNEYPKYLRKDDCQNVK